MGAARTLSSRPSRPGWWTSSARRVDGRRRGLSTLRAGVVLLLDQPVVCGTLVQAAQRRDQVLGGVVPAPAVAARHRVRLDVRHELFDLRRRRLVQVPTAPLLDGPPPVGAVRTQRAGSPWRPRPGRTRQRPARAAGSRELRSGRPQTGPSAPVAAALPARRSAGRTWPRHASPVTVSSTSNVTCDR